MIKTPLVKSTAVIWAIVLAGVVGQNAYASDEQATPSPAAFSIQPPLPEDPHLMSASNEPLNDPVPTLPKSNFDDDLKILVHTGLWAMSLNGEVGVRKFKTPVHESFDDLFKDFDIGGMGGLEIQKGNWVIDTEAVYSKLSSDENITGPLGKKRGIDFSSQMGIVAVSIGYTMVRTTLPNKMPLTLTPAIGVRWTYLDAEINPDDLKSRSKSREWFDPYIGGRAVVGLCDKVDWRTEGSIGGFDLGGSEFTWSVASYIDWQIWDKVALNVGYRCLSQRYDQDNFKWDMTMQGPWIGFTFQLK